MQCPECDEEILLDLTDDAEIMLGLSSELAVRLHAEAVRARRGAVAAGVTRLFGRLVCTECGISFDIAENLAGVSYL